jgi:hypothetical protein
MRRNDQNASGETTTMSTTTTATPAAIITARLDRLPVTAVTWRMVILLALGGCFEIYDIGFTAYVAPGLYAAKIFTPTTVSFFGMTGLASFIAAFFAGMFLGTIGFSFVADNLHLCAALVLRRGVHHGVPEFGQRTELLALRVRHRRRRGVGDH